MSFIGLHPGVSEIAIENPGAFNALSSQAIGILVLDFANVCHDPGTRVIILRGAEVSGKCKAPLAGADLTGLVNTHEWTPISPDDARHHMEEGIQAIQKIRRCCARKGVMHEGDDAGRVFVLGMVDGPCLAGGVEFMFGIADMVIATPRSVFGMREIGLGGMGGWGGPQTLRERLGSPMLVKEMLLALGTERGGDISAEVALARGLINRLVGEDDIESVALGIAKQVVRLDRLAVTFNLDAADYPAGQDCTDAVTGRMVNLMQRSAWVDGVRGFLEKSRKR